MEVREAIEALKNNNELCRDGSEGECPYCEDEKCYCAVALVVSALEEYIAIGTVEECREARERQIPKKLIHGGLYACPNCHTIMLQGAFEAKGKCCKECGQVLDWSETV